ncbi:MAG: AmmeMemoRadiSam system radical SAM enzyme [Candidatus Nanoarchaeia archaeon]|nr:AmmeMemoRadiSam system radical SAM enzyme [Candidatus Nanoarchaeia archaeon]
MKQALFYTKKENKKVQCNLCPHLCKLNDKQTGICGVRKNINGILYSLSYNHPIAINIDPIEKKPLYNFMPNTKTFSIGMVGCNFRCLNCQNWDLSQRKAEEFKTKEITPEQIIKMTKDSKCPSISYTYSEPGVSIEYVLDTAKLAKKNKIKNVVVSNGYINQEPLKEIIKYIDAFNIDLKSINDDFYKKVCSGKLKPVLETLKTIKKYKKHLEITFLVIPTKNDNLKEIEKMCIWIKNNLGKDTPLHISRFFPYYKLSNLEPTPVETLLKARKIAEKYLKYVHIGNVPVNLE